MPLQTLKNLGDQTPLPHRGGAAVGSVPAQGPAQPAVTRQLLGRAQEGWGQSSPQDPRGQRVFAPFWVVWPCPQWGSQHRITSRRETQHPQLPARVFPTSHEEGRSLLHRNTSREF